MLKYNLQLSAKELAIAESLIEALAANRGQLSLSSILDMVVLPNKFIPNDVFEVRQILEQEGILASVIKAKYTVVLTEKGWDSIPIQINKIESRYLQYEKLN